MQMVAMSLSSQQQPYHPTHMQYMNQTPQPVIFGSPVVGPIVLELSVHLDMVVSIVLVIRVLLPICLIMTMMEKILTHIFDCDFI